MTPHGSPPEVLSPEFEAVHTPGIAQAPLPYPVYFHLGDFLFSPLLQDGPLFPKNSFDSFSLSGTLAQLPDWDSWPTLRIPGTFVQEISTCLLLTYQQQLIRSIH